MENLKGTYEQSLSGHMTLMQRLFSFEGRVGRATYWLYTLAVIVITVIFMAVFAAIGGLEEQPTRAAQLASCVWVVILIPILWSGLAVSAKRWHDRDMSAWMGAMGLIPFIGGLWVLVECGFMEGTPGPNRYGDRTY